MFFLLIPESGEGGLESPVLSPIILAKCLDLFPVTSEGLCKNFLPIVLDGKLPRSNRLHQQPARDPQPAMIQRSLKKSLEDLKRFGALWTAHNTSVSGPVKQ